MTTTKHPAVTVHHHPEHGLTHVIPTDGSHDYWVRHADGAVGIRSSQDDTMTWGYLVGSGELEIIESLSFDPIVLDAFDRELASEGISQYDMMEIFADEQERQAS